MNDKRNYLLEATNIIKSFGQIQALNGVDFRIGYGEIVGLLGDNGAGKSTLIKVLSGVYPPDEGQIIWEGRSIKLSSPKDAMNMGISMVYQDLAIIDTLSIFRNMFLAREEFVCRRIGPFRFINIGQARSKTKQALESTGITIRSVDEPAAKLSGGERQSIAIARAIHFEAKLLILDEPTAALGIKETSKVLSYIERARNQGVSVIFITHNVHHVYSVADRFTILARGHNVGTFLKSEQTEIEISELIVSEGKRFA